MANARAENIITPVARGSFVHLFEPEKKPDGTSGMYSMLLLFPKQSNNWMEDLPWLWANISQCLNLQFPGGQGALPAFQQYGVGKPWPVGDGDQPNSLGKYQEAHRGHWVVRVASSNFDSKVNLVNGQTGEEGLMTANQCFSGCFFKVQLNAYYYNTSGNAGVGLGMNNVQFVQEGESLGGGGQHAAEAFGIAPTATSAAGAFQPTAAPVPGSPAPAANPAPPPTVGAPPAAPAAQVPAGPAVPPASAPDGDVPVADWLK